MFLLREYKQWQLSASYAIQASGEVVIFVTVFNRRTATACNRNESYYHDPQLTEGTIFSYGSIILCPVMDK